MGKRVVAGLGILALVLLAAAGGFFYGTSVGEARANAAQQQFFQQRFGGQGRQPGQGQGGPGGQLPGTGQTGQPGQRGAGRFGGGTLGTIEAIEGDSLIVSTDLEETIRVQTTDTTLIEKFTAVKMGDLVVGERVVVSGSRNDDGSITARSIQSLRAFPAPGPEQP